MTTSPWLVPLHLGPLHPIEQYLVFGLAFGPFVVLAVVIAVQRRREAREEEVDHPAPEQGTTP